MTPRRLLLIKHAMPVRVDGVTTSRWELSAEGRDGAARLAKELALFPISTVLTSVEPKAHNTASIVAELLDVPCVDWPDLHEHDRHNVDHLDAPAVFQQRMREMLARPDEVVYGCESSRAAQQRFARAVQAAVAAHADGDLAVVAHGTVITLFVAEHATVEPFDLWRRLGLPSLVVLSLPGLELLEIVECVRPH